MILNYKINSNACQAAPLSQTKDWNGLSTKVNKLSFEAFFSGGSTWESNPSR
jgi:hypothetical protein